MRDIFIIDQSIFIDALTEKGNKNYQESSRELVKHLFRYKISGITIAYMPAEALDKLFRFFLTLEKLQSISMISNIIGMDSTTFKEDDLDLKIPEAMTRLAYKFTLTPYKVYLVTNNKRVYENLISDGTIFSVFDSKEAVNIITHPNFLTKHKTQ